MSDGADRRPPRTRKVLNFQEKLAIVHSETDNHTLAKEFGVALRTIQRVKNERETILQAAAAFQSAGNNLKSRKTTRRCEHKEVETATYAWLTRQRERGVLVSGPMLQKRALRYHEELVDPVPFKGSRGWLDSFKKRYNIKFVTADGEETFDVQPRPLEFIEVIKGDAFIDENEMEYNDENDENDESELECKYDLTETAETDFSETGEISSI